MAQTLEEYSCNSGIPSKLQVPFHVSTEVTDSERIVATLYFGKSVVDDNLKTNGLLSGFHLTFLDALVKEENWKVFNSVLACSVYDIVFFQRG